MSREVNIGDRRVSLESLSGFKVVRAGKMLARITREVSGISEGITEFVKSYRASNSEVMTRAKFEYRQGLEEAARIAQRRERIAIEHEDWTEEQVSEDIERLRGEIERSRLVISAEAWEKSGNQVELAADPSPIQIGAYLLPQVLESAEDEVARLLALITTPDHELREAKKQGPESYTELLDERGEDLLFDAEIEELLELAITAADVLGEKLRGKADRLRTAWDRLTGADQTKAETNGERRSETSSTDSPPPTDGSPTPSSSPIGTTSEPLPSA